MRLTLASIEFFTRDLLRAHDVADEQAASVARIMAWCEGIGRPNFGLQRIPIHLKRLAKGVLNGRAAPVFHQTGPATGNLDGDNGFGYHIAEMAMDHAVALARAAGVGAVGVRRSNFFGAGAWFVKQAADAGMIGLAMSNSFPKVAAHGGILPALGTNPFAFGAPARDGHHLLLDMATSALAGSTVREHMAIGKPLPEGLAVAPDGSAITDPRQVEEGALLPFGGAKGFGLSLLVEILAGVLTSAGVAGGVASMYKDFAREGGNGHFLLAIDVSRWMPMADFHARFAGLLQAVKASGPGVFYPGEVRWQTLAASAADGVEIDALTLKDLEPWCSASGVRPAL